MMDCSLRHFSIFPWCPDNKTSGTFLPSTSSGREYCGYSNKLFENDIKRKKVYLVIIANDSSLRTKDKFKKIAEKYGCARTTVTAINRGVNYKQDDLDYPLRK